VFTVVHCYQYCNAAIIRIDSPAGGLHARERLSSYVYVDRCAGVLAFSRKDNFAKGIPLNAPWLRGRIGILADLEDPRCGTNRDYGEPSAR
jgi:hypothetical protein